MSSTATHSTRGCLSAGGRLTGDVLSSVDHAELLPDLVIAGVVNGVSRVGEDTDVMAERQAVRGYKVPYFAALEPQARLAPHLHAAMRGVIPRAILRKVIEATYVQVWWPPHDHPVYVHRQPVWTGGGYCDPTPARCCPPGPKRSTNCRLTRTPDQPT